MQPYAKLILVYSHTFLRWTRQCGVRLKFVAPLAVPQTDVIVIMTSSLERINMAIARMGLYRVISFSPIDVIKAEQNNNIGCC
jgi:hypothetical protein